MATWVEVPKFQNTNAVAGFLVEPFLGENAGFLGDIAGSDGWTKVPKESADD